MSAVKEPRRLRVGPFVIVQQEKWAGRPIEDRWVLPGRSVVSTEELYDLAKNNDWAVLEEKGYRS